MKKEEIDELVDDCFKKINKYFHKAIIDFQSEDIHDFRLEIKKLKAFFHLINMESGDGFSCRITKRMKTIYGYFAIIQNLQFQLREIQECPKNCNAGIPKGYEKMLDAELQFWKKLSKDYIDPGYDFSSDKKEISTLFPDKLTQKSIRTFIHYTLYELQSISGHSDDYSLDSARKFIEDLYYNYRFINPYISEQQTKLFDEKVLGECLRLFVDFRDKCMMIALLQTFEANKLDDSEKQLLKEMENDWRYEKKELKNQLLTEFDSLQIKVINLNAFAFEDILHT